MFANDRIALSGDDQGGSEQQPAFVAKEGCPPACPVDRGNNISWGDGRGQHISRGDARGQHIGHGDGRHAGGSGVCWILCVRSRTCCSI